MGHLNDTAGDVGAMVGHPLQAGQQVRPDKAQFNGTFPFLQPQNMPVPQLLLQGIHHLLQRLHFGSQRRVVLEEGVQRQVHHFSHRRGEYRQLLLGVDREAQALVADFLCRLHQVDRMVGDPLKVPNDVQKLRRLPAVRRIQIRPAQLHQIGPQHVLILVCLLLRLPDRLGAFGVIVLD